MLKNIFSKNKEKGKLSTELNIQIANLLQENTKLKKEITHLKIRCTKNTDSYNKLTKMFERYQKIECKNKEKIEETYQSIKTQVEAFCLNVHNKIKDMDRSLQTIYEYETNMQDLIEKQEILKQIGKEQIGICETHYLSCTQRYSAFENAMAIQCQEGVRKINEIIGAANK